MPFVEDFDFNCITDEVFVGTWEYDGGNNYIFEEYGNVLVENIIFNNNNNTFSVFDTFTFNGFTFTEELIFIRN